MHPFTTAGRTGSVFPSNAPDSPAIYLNTFSDEGRKVYEAARAAGIAWMLS